MLFIEVIGILKSIAYGSLSDLAKPDTFLLRFPKSDRLPAPAKSLHYTVKIWDGLKTDMLRTFIIGFLFIAVGVFLTSGEAFSQEVSLRVKGTVVNNISKKPVEDASVQVIPFDTTGQSKRNIGISTKRDGSFDLFFNYELPFRLRVSHVSFYPKEIVVEKREEGQGLTIELVPQVIEGEDIIVTAELITKEELQSPVTVDKVSTVDVQQLASFDVFDLVSTLREVDVATQSMTMQSVNTRGFNSSANRRFLQLTNGVDNQAPGLSFPIGNLMGLIDLDVSSVEILPGPSSTKYGSSALNGVLLMKGKDPFMDQGFTFQAKGGLNDFSLSGDTFFSASGNGMVDIQGRYAQALSDKIAFKLTGSHTRGIDWIADNYDNIGYDGYFVEGKSKKHPDNPGYNGVNIYGDEESVYLPVYTNEGLQSGVGGQVILPPVSYGPVTRTGYREEDLVDYEITTTRTAGSLHFKPSEEYSIVLDGRYGVTNSLYTGDSRIRLEGFSIYQGSVDVKLKNLHLLGYSTWQHSGDSYDVTDLAGTLMRRAKADVDWYRDFSIAYRKGIPILGIAKGSLSDAREFADSGVTRSSGSTAEPRYEPGSREFHEQVESIKNSSDPEQGAAIVDNSKLYHLQSSYTIEDIFDNTSLELGGSYRFYDIQSDGTIFPDTASNSITNYEYGGFATLGASVFEDKMKVNIALRVDKNENFDPMISPQLATSYSPDEENHFRLSFQNGFRYPGVREQFINNNLGKARLVGGLPENVGQYALQNNAITVQAIERFNEAVVEDLNKTVANPEMYNQTQAELNNLPLLQEGIVREDQLLGIKPERVNTVEAGYRKLFTRRLFLDLNYYVSLYNDFIGITRVVKPRTSPTLDLLAAAGQVNSSLESDTYYIYSNARDRLLVQGLSFNLEYISGGFMSSINGSWANLIQDSDDPIIPGFNTPPFKMNFEWGHRSLSPNVGFKMVYRLRTKYFWQSSFMDGPIDTYGHFDFQLNFRIPSARSLVKFGVTNWGIKKYYNIFGGPSIGSILFATYTFNPKIF